jgi:hypothetical protein
LVYGDYSPSAHEAEWAERAFAPSTNPSTTPSEGPGGRGFDPSLTLKEPLQTEGMRGALALY